MGSCQKVYRENDKMVYEVKDKADFQSQLKAAGDKLVVVDFYATWCPPCKAIAPEIEKLAKEHEGAVVFLKVDVDKAEDAAADNGISAMPTFIFFKKESKVD